MPTRSPTPSPSPPTTAAAAARAARSGPTTACGPRSRTFARCSRRPGPSWVFGISSGAIVALEAALSSPIRKVVAYEPPLVDGAYDTSFVDRYQRLLERGDVIGAMVAAMKGAQMGPPAMNRLPDWLLRPLVRFGIRTEEKKAAPDAFTMRLAAPTVAGDFRLVRESAGKVERYRDVQADVLLLGGAKSPRYLKDALDALERVLPRHRRVELAHLGHGGSGNADRGGEPATVAREMRAFLAGQVEPVPVS